MIRRPVAAGAVGAGDAVRAAASDAVLWPISQTSQPGRSPFEKK